VVASAYFILISGPLVLGGEHLGFLRGSLPKLEVGTRLRLLLRYILSDGALGVKFILSRF